MSDKYLINSSTLTGIASAIRSKTGSSSAFTPAQMISEIENIELGGQDILPATYYMNSAITSYTGDANYILGYAFQRCINLSYVSFPQCSYIGRDAFNTCSKLSVAYFPKCTYIYTSAFYGCTNLQSLYLSEVESVPFLVSSFVFDLSPLSLRGSGKIYVPSSLYTAFIGNSVWRTLGSGKFVRV